LRIPTSKYIIKSIHHLFEKAILKKSYYSLKLYHPLFKEFDFKNFSNSLCQSKGNSFQGVKCKDILENYSFIKENSSELSTKENQFLEKNGYA